MSADPRFDSRTGNVSLCPWERNVFGKDAYFPKGSGSLQVVVANPAKGLRTNQKKKECSALV